MEYFVAVGKVVDLNLVQEDTASNLVVQRVGKGILLVVVDRMIAGYWDPDTVVVRCYRDTED